MAVELIAELVPGPTVTRAATELFLAGRIDIDPVRPRPPWRVPADRTTRHGNPAVIVHFLFRLILCPMLKRCRFVRLDGSVSLVARVDQQLTPPRPLAPEEIELLVLPSTARIVTRSVLIADVDGVLMRILEQVLQVRQGAECLRCPALRRGQTEASKPVSLLYPSGRPPPPDTSSALPDVPASRRQTCRSPAFRLPSIGARSSIRHGMVDRIIVLVDEESFQLRRLERCVRQIENAARSRPVPSVRGSYH